MSNHITINGQRISLGRSQRQHPNAKELYNLNPIYTNAYDAIIGLKPSLAKEKLTEADLDLIRQMNITPLLFNRFKLGISNPTWFNIVRSSEVLGHIPHLTFTTVNNTDDDE